MTSFIFNLFSYLFEPDLGPDGKELKNYLKEKGLTELDARHIELAKSHVRAVRLYENKEAFTSNESTTFHIEFQTFLDKCPEWGQANGTTDDGSEMHKFWEGIFSNEPKFLILRNQPMSASCYMLSSVVAHHYLYSIQTNVCQPTVNVAMAIHEGYIGAPTIKSYFNSQTGGDAAAFFETLLGRKTCNTEFASISPADSPYHVGDCERIFDLLKVRGPGLVTDFRTEEAFLKDGVSFSGSPDASTMPGMMHAMVLIGAFKSTVDNTYKYLLQNTWSGRYFIEVDSVYLSAVKAQILFVAKTSRIATDTPERFKMDSDIYAEGALDLPVGPHINGRSFCACCTRPLANVQHHIAYPTSPIHK